MGCPIVSALSLKEESGKSGFCTSDFALLAAGEIFADFIRREKDIAVEVGLLLPPDSYSRLVLMASAQDLTTIHSFLKEQNITLLSMPGLELADCIRLCEVEDQTAVSISASHGFVIEYANLLPKPKGETLPDAVIAAGEPVIAQPA